MNLARRAYEGLFPKTPGYEFFLSYSARFAPFNGNIKKQGCSIRVRLSRRWEPIDEDIVVGFIQELLCKLFKRYTKGVDTRNMELYRIFVKNMEVIDDAKEVDPVLQRSFERINSRYFDGELEMPNLRFNGKGYRTLGSYNFHSDTITVTRLLQDAPQQLIDYVVFHELLHKKLKFDHRRRGAKHHTKRFREHEEAFENPRAEQEIQRFLRRKLTSSR